MNGAKLDLFGLYRSVASRGGFPTRESRVKLNWTKDVFPDLNNYTENHRATSAGHDLIGHYQNYLLEYEEAHPDDITTRHTEVDERAEGVADERAEGAERQGGRRRRGCRVRGTPTTWPGTTARERSRSRSPPRPSSRRRPRRRAFSPRASREASLSEHFTVGCKVKVFWRHDDAWYAGVIEDQQGEGDVVLSKIQYEDGDVEVLDLANGRERVRLMERADGTPASDADEPDVFDEAEEEEDDRRGDGVRGRARRRGRDGVSRRAAAKEESPPERAAGSTPVESERRRNPARLASLAHAREGNLLTLAAHEEFPPGDDRVAAVLAAMRGNDVARTLAELPEDSEPSGEVFRLGYRMGARRAPSRVARRWSPRRRRGRPPSRPRGARERPRRAPPSSKPRRRSASPPISSAAKRKPTRRRRRTPRRRRRRRRRRRPRR